MGRRAWLPRFRAYRTRLARRGSVAGADPHRPRKPACELRSAAGKAPTYVLGLGGDGQLRSSRPQDCAEFLDKLLEKDAKPNVKPRTCDRHEEIVKVHIKPAIGDVRLDKLTPHHVATLLAQKRQQGLAARTCLHIHRVLHRALQVAVLWGLTGRNVYDTVRPSRAEEQPPVGLTPEQVDALLEAARYVDEKRPDGSVEQRPNRLYPLFLTAVQTDMRQGELPASRCEDVDLDTGVALVCPALEKPGKQPVFSTPKNRKPRVVPLSPEVVEALRRLRV